jgi:SAM-dependent methyltransferase
MPYSPFSRSRSGGGATGTEQSRALDAPTAEDVARLYEGFLGRAPQAEEVAHQLATAPSLRALLDAVVASEEHQARVSAPGEPAAEAPAPSRVVNVHTEALAAFETPPGTWSADGVAVTGRDGWVFLGAGSNAILDQYRGLVPLPAGFDADWAAAMAERRAGAEALGAAFVALIVPDKLPVLPERFPDPLPAAAGAPAPVLASRPELGLLYPTAELAAVPEGAFLRTDTHLTYEGNAALARLVAERVGGALPSDVLTLAPEAHRYLISGDLGSRFSPPIVEVVADHGGWGTATLAESNREELIAVGGHVGTRQLLRNASAADDRTVVVFGDSYAFADPSYAGLAWFLAQAFREVHFLWIPFGWDPGYAAAAGADVIVCQGAERFAIRPPALRVDVARLAADTLARLGGGGGGGTPAPAPAAAPEADAASSWTRRFPPPARPWTEEYVASHRALVGAAIDDEALRGAAAAGGPLPDGYAVGFDERTVEYPWMFGQGLGGRVLDAGSTFNHTHIVERALPRLDALTIVTLAPEPHQFLDRGVSYLFADLRDLPFRDGWFDLVVSLSTLEHVGKDNEVYGAEGPTAADPDAEVAKAARELRRVTRPGGRILLSVPYGRREDHGWFRQFDAEDLDRLVAAFEAPRSAVSLFRYDGSGWRASTPEEAAGLAYRDYAADPSPVADHAAAARGVACVAITV